MLQLVASVLLLTITIFDSAPPDKTQPTIVPEKHIQWMEDEAYFQYICAVDNNRAWTKGCMNNGKRN